jgi:YggT family protein
MIFFIRLLGFVDWLLSAYMWVVIAAAVITWVNPDPNNPIVCFLRAVTEPLFWRIKRRIPTNFGGLDIAPMLVLFAIIFVQQVILPSLVALIAP